MKKAIVYIDGYNLYFGLLKDTCWKWLDLWKFAECLLDGRYELVEVVYFTAPIKTHPVDLARRADGGDRGVLDGWGVVGELPQFGGVSG